MPRTKQPRTVPTPEQDDDPVLQSQLELFAFVNDDTKASKRYSNTVEIYDSLPKYSWEQRDAADANDKKRHRSVRIRGRNYEIEVRPASITRDGKDVLVYPGVREEIIEDALRKFVVDGQGVTHEREIGVHFTLYQLRKELADHKRTYSFTEIQEAIHVCAGTILKITDDEGKTIGISPIFPQAVLRSRQEYLDSPGDASCYVRFNSLVTKSIMDMQYRRYDYRLGMTIKAYLARWIFRRMSHYWTQASMTQPYTFGLISYLSSSPRGLSPMMSQNRRAMNMALDTLIEHEVVSHYELERITEGRRLIDIKYRVFPTQKYVSQTIAHNQHQQLVHQKKLKQLTENLRGQDPG